MIAIPFSQVGPCRYKGLSSRPLIKEQKGGGKTPIYTFGRIFVVQVNFDRRPLFNRPRPYFSKKAVENRR
jgi:hypothetical protein